MNFEEHLKKTVNEIRSRFAAADIGSLHIRIEVEGRVEAGDMRLKFSVREMYEDWTDGGDLNAVVEECLRRKSWNDRHAPLCLPSAPPDRVEEEFLA